ncbi:MAG TPA: OmpA family protein [Puia sp.]|nr:OmpA family protein [Puia sp.]
MNPVFKIIIQPRYPYLIFLIAIFLFSFFTTQAQSSLGYYNQGEKLFRQKNYDEAAQYYEKFLTLIKQGGSRSQPFAIEKKRRNHTNTNPRQEAVYHLAECYRQEHDYTKAEQRFKESTTFPTAAYPQSQYWYGVSLRANGKYDQAIEAFTSFEKNYNDMGPILIDADRELESLRFIQSQLARANKNSFWLTHQSGTGYTSAYALSVVKGDTVVFTSIHKVDTGAGKKAGSEYRNDLALSTIPSAAPTHPDSTLLAASQLLPLPKEPGLHNGLPGFSSDGKKMFFTRWTKKEGITHSAIWSSDRSDSGWSQPALLGDPINSEGYNSTQPFVTADGKYLLFSSDRPGGSGNYDLWFASFDSNFQIISVSNMGEMINTPGDDESPYYHQNSRTLVFASNGRVGMGGFDIYYARGNFDIGRWDKPKNPGIPINSPKDDLYFVSTDEDNCWNTGWLSSDRHTDCCLALYTVLQDNHQYISGSVIDCNSQQPLAGVQLTVTDLHHGDRVFLENSTDSAGHYHFELKNTSRFRILADKKGYTPGSAAYQVEMETGMDSIRNDALCLRAIPVAPPDAALKEELGSLTRSSVLGNFPYKKSALPASAYVSLDSLAALMNRHPNAIIQVEGYSDGIGGTAYNIRLAQARVNACIRYLVKKGIAPSRLRGKSFGKCCPIAPDTINGKDNPAGREINRRVEYKLVQLDKPATL